jgi:hypothetical protein
MLSLLSDEYRGKTQGLRIGALSSDIKEMKSEIIEPTADGTNTITFRDQAQRDFIILNGPQDEIDFKYGTKFSNGIYTETIYPLHGGGEIDSLGTSLNLLNTFETQKNTGLANLTVAATTFAAASPFAASLAVPQTTLGNFLIPFNNTLGGWQPAVAFTNLQSYRVTVSILGNNSNHPITVALCTVRLSDLAKTDFLARAEMETGIGRSVTLTGVVDLTQDFNVIGLAFYSPNGSTTLNPFDMNITFERIF